MIKADAHTVNSTLGNVGHLLGHWRRVLQSDGSEGSWAGTPSILLCIPLAGIGQEPRRKPISQAHIPVLNSLVCCLL